MTPTGKTRTRKTMFGGEVFEIEVVVTVFEDFGPYGAGTCTSEVSRWITQEEFNKRR